MHPCEASYCKVLLRSSLELHKEYSDLMQSPISHRGQLSDQDLLQEFIKNRGQFVWQPHFPTIFPSWWVREQPGSELALTVLEEENFIGKTSNEIVMLILGRVGAVHYSSGFAMADSRTKKDALSKEGHVHYQVG